MNGGPVETCPMCGYDLRALPKNYQCPECGFEYEESMRVWKGLEPRIAGWVAFAFALALLIIVLLKTIREFQSTKPWHEYLVPFGAPLLFLCLGLLSRIVRGAYIVVGREGILIKKEFRRPQFRPWSDLRLGGVFTTDLITKEPSFPLYMPVQQLTRSQRHELRNELLQRLHDHKRLHQDST